MRTLSPAQHAVLDQFTDGRVPLPVPIAVAGAGLVLGAVVSPAPALASSPGDCLSFTHTSGITTQTVYGHNNCSWGTAGFKVHSWSAISQETSPCIWVNAGQTGGWTWTRGRSKYEIIIC